MKLEDELTLTREQKNAVMLQINQRLYEKGEIPRGLYEQAKRKIMLIKSEG